MSIFFVWRPIDMLQSTWAFLYRVASELELNFFTSKPTIVKARFMCLARSLSTVFLRTVCFANFCHWSVIGSLLNWLSGRPTIFFRRQAEKIVKHPNKFVALNASSSASQSVLTDCVYTRPEMELRRVDSAVRSIEKVISAIEISFSIASLWQIEIQR